MGTARTAQIPVDHVVAEVAAFPLASETALRLALTELHAELSKGTRELWREAETRLLSAFPAFSIDEAVALRDLTWFGGRTSAAVGLPEYLRRIAGLYLARRGDAAVPALPSAGGLSIPATSGPQAAQARRAWRWMSFALPPDLLLAALGTVPSARRVEILLPTVSQVLLDEGYSETHLHVGAAMEFPLLWVCAQHSIARPNVKPDLFQSPGAALNEGRDLGPWLLRALIARYVLAAYLAWARPSRQLEAFLSRVIDARLPAATQRSQLRLALSELGSGRLRPRGPSFASWQSLYHLLTGVARNPLRSDLDRAQGADTIAALFAAFAPRGPTPEMRFVGEALAHLESNPNDPLFAVLFWQVVRVRVLLYRHVVQRPMTPGMLWFIRFYGRLSAVRGRMSVGLNLESAAELQGAGMGLKSLEMRTSPEAPRSELLGYVQSIDRAARKLNRSGGRRGGFEYGLVLHFTKDRGGGALGGIPTADWHWSNADPGARYGPGPSGNPSGYRYARFFSQRRVQAIAFASVLRYHPATLEVVRGIDVCTDELGVPNWVLVPLFDHVREAGEEASAALRAYYSLDVPTLRTTVHVGEDFVHLLSGLRRVDEALGQFAMREGDRIGHGMALGVDPREWVKRAGRLPMPCEDRLFDLAWEWDWYGREGIDPAVGRRSLVEREIYRLSEWVFGAALPAYEVERLATDLLDAKLLRRIGFPNGPRPDDVGNDPFGRARRLLRYLTDISLFLRGRQIEWFEPAAEGEVLAALQAGLRGKVAARGICVEVNPTSNLLIGDLHDLTRHPLWRLRPPRGDGDSPSVSVCIGSDDPITFGTDLRQEYQFLHDALTLAGFSDEAARHWLNRTRASGLETRFTVPRTDGLNLDSFRDLARPVVPSRL